MFIAGWTDKDGNSITWEPLGCFPSPCGKEFSSLPYNKEQKAIWKKYQFMERARDRVIEHLTRTHRSIIEEIELINNKKSTLPRYAKDFLMEINEK